MLRLSTHKMDRVGALLCLCAVLLFPTPAFAWTFEPSEDGRYLTVTWESQDSTANATIGVGSDYKGGSVPTYSSGLYPWYMSSYNVVRNSNALALGTQPYMRSAVVTVPGDGSLVYVNVTQGGVVTGGRALVLPRSAPVAESSPLQSISATVTSAPPVSLDSSISVEGTLPVNVADLPPALWAGFGLGVVALGVVLTTAFIQGVRRAG